MRARSGAERIVHAWLPHHEQTEHRGACETGADAERRSRAMSLPEPASEQAGGQQHAARHGVIQAERAALRGRTGKIGDEGPLRPLREGVMQAVGAEGDILLAISTSGNSKNVLNAIEVARKKGMKVIGLTGKDGGKMAENVDVEIRAPHSKYADRAQEIHIKVIHSLMDYIEAGLR